MKSIPYFLIIVLLLISCTTKTKVPVAEDVYQITKKVADWQIETWEDQGTYRALPAPEDRKEWHHRNKYHDLDWTSAAFYAGLYEFSQISEDNKYEDWLIKLGMNQGWKLHERMYHADDHAVGQFYLSLYGLTGKSYIMTPTMKQFNEIIQSDQKEEFHWTWADALFMAPPVWARLAKVTSYQKYLDYMDQQYHMTYDSLWDPDSQLFYRDKSFIGAKEKNGQKVFWSRGNGWVYGGLALMIPDLPISWNGRDFYIKLFQQMSEALLKTQRKDGTWSAGLLGSTEDYPNIETSGTSFFAFGLAWGINNGYLDKDTYEPILFKAWNAISEAVNEDGMLGNVQPVGAAPGLSYPDFTELYGSGAFLAAGTEMYKYLNKFHAEPVPEEKVNHLVFMKDGGWCWYQDPRAIINKGKLIIGGVDGQFGNVNLGVFDLKSEKADGQVVLHKNLQVDDHDTPALYARPDGSILAVWAKHANEKIHYYNISSTDDYLSWQEPMEFHHDYDHSTGVTYMNLYYLENDKLLYNFFRDGLNFNPAFMTSVDHGKTWGGRSHFIANDVSGRQRPYARYAQPDENTIGISYTDAHPRQYGNSLYYAQFRDGSFYSVDGQKIKDLKDGPLRTSDGEKIFTGSETKEKPEGFESVPNSAWTCAMGQDDMGNPHIGYSLYLTNEDHRFRIASWDGKKWNDREIAYAGRCLYYVESSYTGLMAFDPEDPEKVYISTDVNPTTGEFTGGKHEIYAAVIGANDDINSIQWEAITSGSKNRNIRPIVVAGDGYKALLWLAGPWNTFINYDVDVVGKILEKPE